MQRLSRRDLENLISVAISTAPKLIIQRSKSRGQAMVGWSTTGLAYISGFTLGLLPVMKSRAVCR